MDRVRFGRALGFGARQAVKTLVTAVDAATAENPSAPAGARVGRAGTPAGTGERAGETASAAGRPGPETAYRTAPVTGNRAAPRSAATADTRTATRASVRKKGVGHGVRRFGEAVWSPFVRLSGVLWLEVTGVFFGIFALFAAGGVWRLRGAWRASADAASHRSLLGAAAMAAIFGYFCVSSFVRARRRERGR